MVIVVKLFLSTSSFRFYTYNHFWLINSTFSHVKDLLKLTIKLLKMFCLVYAENWTVDVNSNVLLLVFDFYLIYFLTLVCVYVLAGLLSRHLSPTWRLRRLFFLSSVLYCMCKCIYEIIISMSFMQTSVPVHKQIFV